MERRGSISTEGGKELIRKSQERYERWWLGKTIDHSPMTINDRLVRGVVQRVKYVGNSVYGVVILYLDNGCEFIVGSNGNKPTKKDVNIIDN